MLSFFRTQGLFGLLEQKRKCNCMKSNEINRKQVGFLEEMHTIM